MLSPALCILACQPSLDPALGDCHSTESPDGTLLVALEPEAALDAAPPVLRFRLRTPDGQPIAPEQLALVAGKIGPSQLGQLARDEISDALRARMLPAMTWTDDDGSIVLAPTTLLELGEKFALGSGSPKGEATIIVAAEDPLPQLRLVWPPDGAAAGVRSGVWCGAAKLPPLVAQVSLAPSQLEARLRTGAINAVGDHCVHLEQLASDEEALLAPPLLLGADGEALARLEPVALRNDAEATPVQPIVCELDERRFGPGCLRVADDRAWLTTPTAPLLWAVDSGSRHMVSESHGETLLIAPLQPASTTVVTLETLDLLGNVTTSAMRIDTLGAMPHVVINEVLANPIGEEPEQEWVELYNDGVAAAQLGGYTLGDIGGEAVLPWMSLGPGEYAVIVNADFDPTSDYDPLPASTAKLIVVDKLGKNGLSNQGEPLKLLDADGQLVSRFPASPKPQAGRSVMRLTPKALDTDPDGFALSEEGASTPGSQ
jgi:hypothetical protein